MGISFAEIMEWATNRVNRWRYNQRVPEPQHIRNAALSKSFFREIIDYLEGDIADKLTPLMLNPQQSEIMEYALNLSLKDYAACPDDLTRILGNYPLIKRSFESNTPYGTNDGGKTAHFIFTWNVSTEFPAHMAVLLFAQFEIAGALDFRFSNQKVTSNSQLDFLRSNAPGVEETFLLYENGSRILQKSINSYTEEKEEEVTQYSLIGDFHSKAAHSHEWVYASNLDILNIQSKIKPLGVTPCF